MDKIANLYKDVKYRNQAISYQAEYFIGGCNFELLINGFPIERHFSSGDGSLSASAPINSEILKSGEQTWEIRVYPVHIDGIPQQSISDGARAELKIQAFKFKENGDIAETFEPVLNFEAPLKKNDKTGKNIFADSGKPYVSYKGTFTAEVPYSLQGWTNGEEFNPADSVILKKEVLNKFNEIRNLIVNKEAIKFEDIVLNKEREVAQALFMKETDSRDIANFYSSAFNNSLEGFSMVPIDNEEIVYYCDNKVLTLLFTAKKCIRCKGESVLSGRFKDGDKYRVRSFYIYLYRPKGKKELEVIR
ncbi:hypothetical protein GSF70_11165 [Flavobacteriaceae bacterium W22]|nr:hypothetical protein [Flavobacteriaceae bacterium W22]